MAVLSAGRTPADLLPFVRESVGRLLRTAGDLDEEAVRGPSLLPGWSRAHVLAHIAGAADSRTRLLSAARTGAPIPQYRDERARTEQIDADAVRSPADLLDRVRAATAGVIEAIGDHPADAWDRPVEWLGGAMRPVRGVVPSLLQELEIHHVDLDAGYGPADWPGWFTDAQLRRVLADFAADDEMQPVRVSAVDLQIEHDFSVRGNRSDADSDGDCDGAGGTGGDRGAAPLVSGAGHAVLAWLIGRSPGEDLTLTPPGRLPVPPPWRQ